MTNTNNIGRIEFTVYADGCFVDVCFNPTDEYIQSWLDVTFAHTIKRAVEKALRARVKMTAQCLADEFVCNFEPGQLHVAIIADEANEEALSLAEEDLLARLAIDGLPPPKSIRDHAQVLVDTDPRYTERARQRLLARAEIVRETVNKVPELDI